MDSSEIQGIVENGQIRLLGDAKPPEKATVHVVLPDASTPLARIAGPRLANPADAAALVKLVISEVADY